MVVQRVLVFTKQSIIIKPKPASIDVSVMKINKAKKEASLDLLLHYSVPILRYILI